MKDVLLRVITETFEQRVEQLRNEARNLPEYKRAKEELDELIYLSNDENMKGILLEMESLKEDENAITNEYMLEKLQEDIIELIKLLIKI